MHVSTMSIHAVPKGGKEKKERTNLLLLVRPSADQNEREVPKTPALFDTEIVLSLT